MSRVLESAFGKILTRVPFHQDMGYHCPGYLEQSWIVSVEGMKCIQHVVKIFIGWYSGLVAQSGTYVVLVLLVFLFAPLLW